MHAFQNTGFETAGSAPGLADAWTFVFVCTGEEFASYDATVPEAVEDFEEEWGNDETTYELGTTVVAGYDTTPMEPVEDFEEEWGNEPHYWVWPGGVVASYHVSPPGSVENFEREWSDNEDDVWSLGDVPTQAAPYDLGTPEDYENFEEEWSSNENGIFEYTGAELVAATFDGEDFEDFEEVDLRMATVEVLAVGADTDKFILTVNGVQCIRVATGVGTVDTERDFLISAVNSAAVGATATADGTGKIKLRSTVSGDPLTVTAETTGATAKMVMLSPPDKTLYWTQTGELDL